MEHLTLYIARIWTDYVSHIARAAITISPKYRDSNQDKAKIDSSILWFDDVWVSHSAPNVTIYVYLKTRSCVFERGSDFQLQIRIQLVLPTLYVHAADSWTWINDGDDGNLEGIVLQRTIYGDWDWQLLSLLCISSGLDLKLHLWLGPIEPRNSVAFGRNMRSRCGTNEKTFFE